jgi:DNA-binding transcriptional LysR family regulator
MELSHLRYFYFVAEAESFTRGARAAHVTPPALSKAIRILEDELGTNLFERTTRSVRLTTAGRAVLGHCRAIFAEVEALKRRASSEATAIGGELRIGAMEVFSIALLPTALGALVKAHPQVEPQVYEMSPDDMARALDRGSLDVAFTIGGSASSEIDRQVLGTSRACVVCGPTHPLARRPRVSRRELEAHTWIVPRFFGRPLLPAVDQYPDAAAPRRVGATIELLQTGITLTAEGPFLACFPEISIRRELESGRLRELVGGPRVPAFELAVLSPKNAAESPTIDALVAEMRRVLAQRARRANR